MALRTNQQATYADTARQPGTQVVLTGSSSTVLADSQGGRVVAFISNTHATVDAYLSLGGTAATGQGVYLKAGGGSVVIDNYSGLVTGIGNGATLAVAEV